nr:UPF0481 protein At3g47200-like [Quercus suber]
MKEESFSTPRYCPTPCTMFRAPTNMRQVNEHAYDPVLVSIGPFHYKKALLQGMEEHKLQFLFGLMRYQSKEEKEHRFQRLAEAMKRLEGRARWCYSEAFDDISTDDFVRMMVIDGCFILELFRYYQRSEKEKAVELIPYRTGRYGQNLSYRQVNRYRNTHDSYRLKFRSLPDYTGRTAEYRTSRPKNGNRAGLKT